MLVGVEDNYPPKDNVFRVEWNLGKRCNYDCSYCSPSIHDKKSPHLSLDIVKKTVLRISEHAKKNKKKVRISLTGGEPYLHPNFIEIIRFIKENGVYRISVTSNGSLTEKTYTQSMNYVDYLIISVHFEFTKIEKLKEKLTNIKRQLGKNKGLHIHVMAIPTKVEEALSFTEFLKKEDISYALRRVRPQFDKEGLYLYPFNSGQEGDNPANLKKIKDLKLNYYTPSEKSLLGIQV